MQVVGDTSAPFSFLGTQVPSPGGFVILQGLKLSNWSASEQQTTEYIEDFVKSALGVSLGAQLRVLARSLNSYPSGPSVTLFEHGSWIPQANIPIKQAGMRNCQSFRA